MSRVNKMLLSMFLAVSVAAPQAHAEKKLKVITTTTDLADIAARIAGDRASVESLARGFQNPHFVDAKPSLIVKLMDADLYVETGLELESGWSPLLLRGSRNKRILPGGPGFVEAGSAIEPLEVPEEASRAEGDVHPHGNPHFMMDPANARPVAQLIARRLTSIDAEGKAVYEANLEVFLGELDRRLAEWQKAMAPFKGRPFVSYHRDWSYFAHRFGLESAGEIEPKPGIPPTATHTAEIIGVMKKLGVKIIITDPWYESKTGQFIARETGAKLLNLSLFPGGVKGIDGYFETVEYNVRTVASALGGQ